MSGTQAHLPHANDGGLPTRMDPELAQALLLVRVSTMKMLRLQLAIERRDRPVAMQAVEDLMELDAWMAGSAMMPADAELMEAIAAEVDDQRGALLHEKFGLAAGLVRRPAEPPVRPWAEPVPEGEELVHDIFGPVDAFTDNYVPERRTRWWLVATIAILLLAVAALGAAFAFGWGQDILQY